jgi:hypothetical protein
MPDGSVFARVHVLILCDEIEEHVGEEEVLDLRGVRTHIWAGSFPYTHPQLWVYLQMSGHEGTVTERVVVTSEANDEIIAYLETGVIQFQGPLTLVELAFSLLNCVFPAPGVYWFQVFMNEKLVSERRFSVTETPGGSNGQASR